MESPIEGPTPQDTKSITTNINDISSPSHLSFDQSFETSKFSNKVSEMEKALADSDKSFLIWSGFAKSEGGLVNDNIRKIVWPILGGVQDDEITDAPQLDALSHHSEYHQVKLDVDRSLKRFPPGIPYEKRVELQDQLTVLILRVIIKYPFLKYYQGYHDIAITFLLVCGEKASFPLLCRISYGESAPLAPFMQDTMEPTQHLLNYLLPLISKENKDLATFLRQSGVGTMYALPWFLTWFGHSLNRYTDVVRLYDYFLCSPPLFPIYVTAAIVLHRGSEIFNLDCDMASVHCFLSQLPEELPFEDILMTASKLYQKYSPQYMEKFVVVYEKEERAQLLKEEEKRKKQIARYNGGQKSYWVERFKQFHRIINDTPLLQIVPPRYRALIAATTVLFGAYAYYKFDCSPLGLIR